MICEEGVALSCSMKQHTANSMKVTVKSIPHTLLKRRSDAEIWVAQSIWKSTSILATLDGLVQELSRKRENPRLDMTCLDFSWQWKSVCLQSQVQVYFNGHLFSCFQIQWRAPFCWLTDWLDCRSACFIVCMCCPEKSKVRVLTLTEAMRSNSLCVSMKRGRSPQKTCSMPVRGSLTGGTIWPSPAAAPPLP